MQKNVILLNGPSGSGKSTLAAELQRLVKVKTNEVYSVVSIDDFLTMTTEDKVYEDDVFDISLKLCNKALDDLQMLKGVIIDHVITSERIFIRLTQAFKQFNLHVIKITCPIEILKQREANRKNRCIGSAEASFKYLYPKDGYDLILHTHAFTASECALQISELM